MNVNDQKSYQNYLKAREMLLNHYITHIVEIETTLSTKQIRAMYHSLKNDGLSVVRSSRTLRTSATLISSRERQMEASIIASIYRNIIKQSKIITKHDHVDIESVNKSYSIYMALRKELTLQTDPFEISDAWSLIRDLRINEAILETCNHCNSTFFSSFRLSSFDDCPFCLAQRESKKENKLYYSHG